MAVDVNERYVYYGNSQWIRKVETPVEKAVRLRELAEELERKYWRRATRRGVGEAVYYTEYAVCIKKQGVSED